MASITWRNTTIKLSDLRPWKRNPRRINEKEAERLAQSFDEFGQVETVAIGPDNEVYNGHQRLGVLLKKHGEDYQIEARQAHRALTEKEREKLVVYLHRGAVGEWDTDALAEWDGGELVEWGFGADEVAGWKEPNESEYSRKITSPIYTPQSSKPAIENLCDETKTNELLAEIEAVDIPEDEKRFLRIAARRHTVINFQEVAEYYAQSSELAQRLMEDSALVIIDFNRAIELGYVKLSEEISGFVKDEHGDE